MSDNRKKPVDDSPSALETFLWGGVACCVVALTAIATLFWWEFLTPLNQHIVKTLPQDQAYVQTTQQQTGTIPVAEPNSLRSEDPQDSAQEPPAEPEGQDPSLDSTAPEDAVTPPEDSTPTAPASEPSNGSSSGTKVDTNSGQGNTSSNSSNNSGNNESGLVLNPSNGNDMGAGTSSTQTNNSNNANRNDSENSQSSGTGNTSGSGNWGESSITDEITGDFDQTAYWVDSGYSYHFSTDCISLSRSKNIHEGTLQDALNAGKTDPCNHCANGS